MSSPSLSQLHRALKIQERIDELEAELKEVLSAGASTTSFHVGNGETPPRATKAKKKKSGMSPEGRARIAAAQRARWAKARGEKASTPAASAPKKRRKMSAAARAKIAAAQKRRWAKVKRA
jgi:hypothetical protein